MLICLLIFILFSNAITIRRDKSILLCRIVITSLIITIKPHNIMINSYLSTSISTLTLILLFIYSPEEWFSNTSILVFCNNFLWYLD